jgi:hypothetical protein
MSAGGWDEASRAIRHVLDERAIFPLYQPIVGPAPTMPATELVHPAPVAPDIADRHETAMVVLGPHLTAALCAEPGDGDGGMRFVLTHDADLVHMVGRMLLHRLDRTSARLTPPSSRPWGTPAG